MTVYQKLPRGIRNNNPGNLKAYVNTAYNDGYDQGYAIYRSPTDGLMAMLTQIAYDYRYHGCLTLSKLIARWAPASENDVQAYIIAVCKITGWNPLHAASTNIRIDRFPNALRLAKAIVRVECGDTPPDWPSWPEWYSYSEWIDGAKKSEKWGVI